MSTARSPDKNKDLQADGALGNLNEISNTNSDSKAKEEDENQEENE